MRKDLAQQMLLRGWVLSIPLFLILWYFPVIYFSIRLAGWAAAVLVLAGSIYFSRKFKWIPFLLSGLYAGLILFIWLGPGSKTVDRNALRVAYCTALQDYLGTRYVWGGETYSTIDCSGLVRKALEDALTQQGFYHGNAGLVRSAIWLYWHDTTAKILGEGYSGLTLPFATHIDYSQLQPGDLVVLDHGIHVIAYLGDKTWIAADPGVNKVILFRMPENSQQDAVIVRWKVLSDS